MWADRRKDGQRWTDGQRRADRDGRTDGPIDRHDEANIRFSQFCELALKQDMCCLYLDPVIPLLSALLADRAK